MNTQELFDNGGGDSGVDAGQKVMIGLIIAVIAIGGYFVFRTGDAPRDVPANDQLASVPAAIGSVVDGDTAYAIGALRWIFEDQGTDESGVGLTRVRLKLDQFSKNGKMIDVGPYRLGSYRGVCKEFAALSDAQQIAGAGVLAFAQCASAGTGRQLAVFQEGDVLVIKSRPIGGELSDTEPLATILTIDIKKIIQPL